MGVKQSPCNTKPELIYWDSQSFTLIKQTRQPWALETLVYPVCLKVAFFFFFTVKANSFHRLHKATLVWAAQSHTADSVWPDSRVTDVLSDSYVSYFFIHTSVIWAWRNCDREGDEPVEVKGQALWSLETGFARNEHVSH